jgi:hypothetical protein
MHLGDVLDAVGALGQVLVETLALCVWKRPFEVLGDELDELVAGQIIRAAHAVTSSAK